ncbi:MAG: hypothetical protein PF689_07560 [Deltaproteobacteria bacterium]|jgi:hypothetical protein|nr:hypothetical protein [Deltaproteobacteria bacterium]
MKVLTYLFLFFSMIGSFSCTSPRSITHTGKVTPKGQIRLGANVRGNIPTETSSAIYDTIKDGVNELEEVANGDQGKYTEEEGKAKLDKLMRALLIYSIDPLGMGFDFNVRYGLLDRWDAGYKFDSGVHVLDTRFQFAGPTRNSNNFMSINLGPKWFGSIGLQFSMQDYNISLPGLDKLQELLGYEFKKYDLMIPLAFSYSFASKDEKYGSMSFGAVYNYSRLNWGMDEGVIQDFFVESMENMDINVPQGERNIHSYGVFFNLKVGYKYIYLVASLSIYYQDYGKYELFGSSSSFSGFTFIPTIGLLGQFR